MKLNKFRIKMLSSILRRSNIFRHLLANQPSVFSSSLSSLNPNTRINKIPLIPETRPDRLFKKISLEIRLHDVSVIDSYIDFTKMAAENLNIPFQGIKYISAKKTKSYIVERQICLRSAFVHKKHREQYEWRTYIKYVDYANLPESTAETFLEYIERNLPEGCSMIVHKFEAIKLFDQLQPPSSDQ